jgi:hypothetical protein
MRGSKGNDGMRQKTRGYRLKRMAWVEPEMMESEAFRSLDRRPLWVLLRFHQKVTWSEMKQGGRKVKVYEKTGLVFTYHEAEGFGIPSGTFLRSIRILVEKGFLDVEYRGGRMGQGRDYSRFKLSDRWRKWGTNDFQEAHFERERHPGMDVLSRVKSKSTAIRGSGPLPSVAV